MKSRLAPEQPIAMIAIKTEMTQQRFDPDDLVVEIVLYFLKHKEKTILNQINICLCSINDYLDIRIT